MKRIVMSITLAAVFLTALFFVANNIIEYFLINKSHMRRIYDFYLTNKENNLVLLIGSSQVREGFDAVLMQSKLKNYNVYNLGYSGDAPTRRSIDLPYIIRLKPKIVVYGIDYFQLSGNYKQPLDDYRVITDLADIGDNPKINNFFTNDINDILHWNWIQIVSFRLRSLVPAFSYLFNNGDNQKKATFYNLKQPFSYSGILSKDGKMKQFYSIFDSRYVVAEKKNEEKVAFTYILNSLRKYNIRVIVVDMPNHPVVSNAVTATSKKNYRDFIESEVKKRCDLYMSYKEDYGDSFFYDSTHLNKAGRDKLSTAISDKIAAVLKNP